jgi:hypothetical protein
MRSRWRWPSCFVQSDHFYERLRSKHPPLGNGPGGGLAPSHDSRTVSTSPATVPTIVIAAAPGVAKRIHIVTVPSSSRVPVTGPKASGGKPTSPANQKVTRPRNCKVSRESMTMVTQPGSERGCPRTGGTLPWQGLGETVAVIVKVKRLDDVRHVTTARRWSSRAGPGHCTTRTGVSRSIVVPSPSWPKPLTPQQ